MNRNMNSSLVLLLLLVFSGVLSGCQTQRPAALRDDLREVIRESRDSVFPALVHVSVYIATYDDGAIKRGRGSGSGSIIDSEGHVVTNAHVVYEGEKYICTLSDKQQIPATLVGADPLTDLAVLKLDLSAYEGDVNKLPVAKWGNSDALQVGDYVLAMGSPFSLSRSVTLGIVSNVERVLANSSEDIDRIRIAGGQRSGLFTRWIQHDALIQPGNSGGPLVNLAGQIVGINTRGGNAIGFSIPSNQARSVADRLIAHGEVERSWLGVDFRTIEGTGNDKGVLVSSVVKDGPADAAGLEPGDLILSIDKNPVTVEFLEQVPTLLASLANRPVGTKLALAYERDGKTYETVLTTERLEKDRGERENLRLWGLTVEQSTPVMVREFQLPSEGALVTGIRSGSAAQRAEPALSVGDVILRVDDKEVKSISDVVDIYNEYVEMEESPEQVLIEFDRSGQRLLTLIEPKEPEPVDPTPEIRKAWIGVATQPVTEKLAKGLGDNGARGFRITRIYRDTVAAKSDLQVGDIITHLEGEALQPLGEEQAGLFEDKVRQLRRGREATLTVHRGDESKDIKILLEPSKRTAGEMKRDTNQDFGIVVRDLTFFDREDARWDQSIQGVLVVGGSPIGWAAEGGVRGGDLIQRIGDQKITDVKSFRKAMEEISEAQPETVVFSVVRGARTRFLFVECDWKPKSEEESGSEDSESATEATESE